MNDQSRYLLSELIKKVMQHPRSPAVRTPPTIFANLPLTMNARASAECQDHPHSLGNLGIVLLQSYSSDAIAGQDMNVQSSVITQDVVRDFPQAVQSLRRASFYR
jgi:hypothetical protein